MYKSRSLRRVKRVAPGGKVKLHYRKRKPKVAHCSKCKAVLKGIPRERPYKMMNMPKTKKRPERPYAGKLCSPCLRHLMKEEARKVTLNV